jgi:hypothetical protein
MSFYLLLLLLLNFAQNCCPYFESHFNIKLLQGKIPTLWKQAAFDPVFKNGKGALITNYNQSLF